MTERTGAQPPAGPTRVPGVTGVSHQMMGRALHPMMFQHLMHMLNMIESTYHVDEMLHAWHVQVLRNHPEIARDPAMERFGHAGEAALRAKVALAGLIKRVLLGDMPMEAMQLLADQLRAWHTEHQRTAAAFQELAAKPEAMKVPALQAMRYLMSVGQRGTRALLQMGTHLMGVELPALAPESWEAGTPAMLE